MKKEEALTQETFDQLLRWLDSDREQAGKKYEVIRLRLIKTFSWRGANNAEELADETINRVTDKINMMMSSYSGDPLLYFYGVAQKVFLEYMRKKPEPSQPPAIELANQDNEKYDCLNECLEKLDLETRSLILQYYQEEKRAKIDHRKVLAEQLGITPHNLRMRTHRIKSELKKCIANCLERK